ncbi:neutral cholesterol ester hydrolase 1-like [Diadema setosum]|uniref:neutral cholesterol ester hydrolase 1-like n=1 Tax=Diadema setosum TaxID=31175 RepID=UPI003B3B31D8
MKEMMNSMLNNTPEPPEEVPGSNIRSRLTSFGGVKVRVYEPKNRDPEATLPALVYLHGGGLVTGHLDMYHGDLRMLSERLGVAAVAVSYRLAPEHPYPAAFGDAFAATRWLLAHPKEIGIDPQRVVVSGDSAGGLLTAAVSGAIADDPSVPDIKLQVLFYPWLQSLDLNTPSYQKMRSESYGRIFRLVELMPIFISAAVLGSANQSVVQQISSNNHTSADVKRSAPYRDYISHSLIPKDMMPESYKPPESDDYGNEELWNSMKTALTSWKLVPLMRDDLSKLPRAFVATCGYDVLRDDGIMYVKRLDKAGVPVEWVNYETAFHGIPRFGPLSFEIGRKMYDDSIAFIEKYL